MKVINHLLDYSKHWGLPDVYLFTGNATIRNDGAIVMGRGAAKQVRDTYERVPFMLANAITKNPNASVIFTGCGNGQPSQHIGWFKVKHHWSEAASNALIVSSTRRLTDIALKRPNITFHMNYPGVGNGRLEVVDVERIIKSLPDNVLIYR